MHVMVTGGAGYIGSVTTATLLAAGHEVTVLDDLSTGHRDAVPDGATFRELDIGEVARVLRETPPVDAVIHFAAISVVGESMQDPARYWHNNVVGTLALLDAMREHHVERIVFSSSAATYGDVTEQPITEDAPCRPASPYGATKLAVDLALADYARAYGFAAISLRYFNVAGALHDERGSWGERHPTETHLIPLALRAATTPIALSGADTPLALYGTDYPTPDGTGIRDYIHVVDLADAHLRAVEAARPVEHEVINLGSGIGYSVREVLATVEKVTGQAVPVQEQPRRPGDPARLVASNTRAADVLGWRPTRDLVAMVEDAWRLG
jgi:UDP-glucose 4-epimerase